MRKLLKDSARKAMFAKKRVNDVIWDKLENFPDDRFDNDSLKDDNDIFRFKFDNHKLKLKVSDA